MTDVFRKAISGQRFIPSADQHNAMIDAAKDYREKRGKPDYRRGDEPALAAMTDIQNFTGADVPIHGVLVRSVPMMLPSVDVDEFQFGAVLQGILPTAAGQNFVVCYDPIPQADKDGTLFTGRAIVAGHAVVQVNVTDSTHTFATTINGDATKLVSDPAQGAQIIWKDSGTGVLWAVILLPIGSTAIVNGSTYVYNSNTVNITNNSIFNFLTTTTVLFEDNTVNFDGATVTITDQTQFNFGTTNVLATKPPGILDKPTLTLTGAPTWTPDANTYPMLWNKVDGIDWEWNGSAWVAIPCIGRTAKADVNHTSSTADRLIAYTSLTAARVVTLPAANSLPGGFIQRLQDESGSASASLTLSYARAGGDTVNGGSGNVVAVNTARGGAEAETDGVSNWTVRQYPGGTGAVIKVLYVSTANVDISNTVTETTLLSAAPTLAANSVAVGTVIRIKLWANFSNNLNGDTIQVKVKLDGNLIVSTAVAATPVSISGGEVTIDVDLIVRATGATGKIIGMGLTNLSTSIPGNGIYTFIMVSSSPVTIDFTASHVLDVTWTWGAAAVADDVTAINCLIEQIG